MTTSCIAFFSQAGIVAASDSDFSIRPLSKVSPIAIAVNISASIPWKAIIDDYLLQDDSRHFATLEVAYDSFAEYFRERKIPASSIKKDSKEHILFMGYNENNIYPSLVGADIRRDDKPELEFSDFFVRHVTHLDPAFYNAIGDFNFVSPVLAGASDPVIEAIAGIEVKLLSNYRSVLINKMEETNFRKKWISKARNFDIENAVDDKLCDSIQSVMEDVTTGLDSLSIGEMVGYAESLVNAEGRLRLLRNKGKGNYPGTREIAVFTIPEGITWIKHSLFAL